MKKTFLFLLLLVVATRMSAQSLLVGDANQDGVLTVADVTETANLIVASENQSVLDLAKMAYKVDNSAVVGTWYLDGDAVTFAADGTTDFMGAASYKFLPLQGSIILYDAAQKPVSVVTVADITEDELLFMVGGTLLAYSSTAHSYVNLGLPSGTLWATCNIGADSPEDYGDYFAWGETTGYTQDTSDGRSFDWASYQHNNGSSCALTKYCDQSSHGYNGFTDDLTELELEDDAAYVNWGSDWRMPSLTQFQELINSSYTTTTWTTQNGVYGRLITSKSNGNTLFLPATGCRGDASLSNAGSSGFYWSRTLSTDGPSNARLLYFGSDGIYTGYNGTRFVGQSVRPVRLSQ